MSYRSKSTDSFITRKRFFIFDCVTKGKDAFTDVEFLNFKITENLINSYTSEYFQFNPNDKLTLIDCSFEIGEIYDKMKSFEIDHASSWKTLETIYFEIVFKRDFPEHVYNAILNSKSCYYCEITMDDIRSLVESGRLFKKNERGWCFEIDRKKPNMEYSTENCVAACYWCNNAKTDEFDDEEFKPIGELIGKTLKARLNK